MASVKIKLTKENKIEEIYSDEIDVPKPFVIVSADEWQQFSKYNKEDLLIENGKISLKKINENVVIVPRLITRLQAKLQLLEIGLLDEVEDLVAQDRKVQLYWKEADNFYRTDSILLGMATTIGLTDEQLDELFIEASKL